MNDLLPASLRRLLAETPALNQAFLVGGCVRDWLLGEPVKDFDVEVYGLDYESLARELERWGRVDFVGRSFGVIKLTTAPGETFDFVLPRLDSKTAPGHKGFAVTFDPAIRPHDAAARRDFTINAMMWDPRRHELLDFFGGQEDLRERRLRHTSSAFPEDPLRVLRGMQFAGRFNLTGAPDTLALCRDIREGYAELAVERVREEWAKWAAKSTVPGAGLRFLRDSGWVAHFPEVAALVGVPQDPEWHPEGDVWTHTLHCLDALVTVPRWREADEETRVILTLAVLAHDFGKPACTHVDMRHGSLRIVSPGHEPAGAPIAERFLHRLGAPNAWLDRVPPLVANHLCHLQEITPRSVRRLAARLAPATIEMLISVMIADAFGRPPLPRLILDSIVRLDQSARELALAASAPRPLLLGRHLIERGLQPGRAFKPILDAAFEAQLDGVFTDVDGALRWLDQHLAEEAVA